jgi:hypothetical protein
MYKEFDSFEDGIQALRRYCLSVDDLLYSLPLEASECEVINWLAFLATREDKSGGKRPSLYVSGSEVWYQSSCGLQFGWCPSQYQPDKVVFYLRIPERGDSYSERDLVRATLKGGFLIEPVEALRVATAQRKIAARRSVKHARQTQ